MMHDAVSLEPSELAASDPVRDEFAPFFAAMKQPMTRLAFLLTASAQQSEDVVQDSFVRVFERWSRIDDHAAYLKRAVVNRCTSWHRHAGVVRRTQTRVATAESYVDRPDEILDALLQLPPRRRAVVVLSYYERLDADEIGRALGMSSSSVRSTLSRGLAQLKGILQ